MILATGFRYAYPFLPHYYDGAIHAPQHGSATTPSPFLPPGRLPHPRPHPRIPRRSVARPFISPRRLIQRRQVSLGTITYLSLDYTTLALAKVWTHTAKPPNNETIVGVVRNAGYGK